MTQKRIVILGALSAIGEATARLYAAQGAHLVLAGRSAERLEQVSADLKVRGASDCHTFALDLAAPGAAKAFSAMVERLGGEADGVFLFYGLLGDQAAAEADLEQARQILAVNFSSAAEWCLAAAGVLERQDSGVLVAISSVAGDRGRQSNYIYGAAKGGLTTLVQGIAHRLAKGRARAVAVKLGFVDTPMTAHIKKGGPLWAKPDAVAVMLKGIADKGGRSPIVYVPSFWRLILLVIRSVPAPIFHKTKL